MPETNEQTPLVTQNQEQVTSPDRQTASCCFYSFTTLIALVSILFEIYTMYLNEQKISSLQECTKDDRNACHSEQWLYFSDYFATMHFALKIIVPILTTLSFMGLFFILRTNRQGDAEHSALQISMYTSLLSFLFASMNGILVPFAYAAKEETYRLSRLSFGASIDEKSIRNSTIFLDGMISNAILLLALISLPLSIYSAYKACRAPSRTMLNQYTPISRSQSSTSTLENFPIDDDPIDIRTRSAMPYMPYIPYNP